MNDIVNQRRRTVVVVPLSSAPSASPPILVPIRYAGRDAVAVIDQIRAVSKQHLSDRLGEVTAPELAALEEALREVLDLG
jgi:mRNA-degrading endonuclease toxin of MazEF toxin-antitoxin module